MEFLGANTDHKVCPWLQDISVDDVESIRYKAEATKSFKCENKVFGDRVETIMKNSAQHMASIDDYFHGYMLNKLHPSGSFANDLKDKVDGDWKNINEKFFDKSGVTLESLRAMELFAFAGQKSSIEKSLKKLVKDASSTQNEGTTNEVFFVTSKNTYNSDVLNPTVLNFMAIHLIQNFDSKDMGLTSEKLAAWRNYFEQKSSSSSDVNTVGYSMKAMSYLKDHAPKAEVPEKPASKNLFGVESQDAPYLMDSDKTIKYRKPDGKKVDCTVESPDPSLHVFLIIQKDA